MPICRFFHVRVRLGPHLLLVQQAKQPAEETAPRHLASEEKILRDRHRRGRREVLIQRLDTVFTRVDRIVEMDRLSIDEGQARIRDECARQRFDQR